MSQPRMRPERAGMELGGCEERLPEESRWAGKGPGSRKPMDELAEAPGGLGGLGERGESCRVQQR